MAAMAASVGAGGSGYPVESCGGEGCHPVPYGNGAEGGFGGGGGGGNFGADGGFGGGGGRSATAPGSP